MRIVHWTSQERVDLPDQEALSFLPLGEFRRTLRAVVLGAEQNRILRGFAAEAESPASSRIVVKLDNGGGVLSAALGAENLGATISHGALVGDMDDDANLEGNAEQTLDFTGQPPATYRVQMRFTYVDGAADNRAFWDSVLDSESITNVPTRHLPGFELRLSGAASDEWIDLADVVWGGSTITAGNITDVRTFAFEGSAPYDAATQAALGNEFSRSAIRAAVGVNAIYPVLRALARQIADIKGQSESFTFDWYSRVYGPTDALDALPEEQTRSLRTVDTVVFTVGDGASTFGDFNGSTGLELCLQHIEDMGANTPNSIEIVCKSRKTGTPAPYVWPVTTAHTINASCDRLLIDFQGNAITASHPIGTAAILMSTVGDTEAVLEIRNLVMAAAPTNNAVMFQAKTVHLSNSTVLGDISATAEPAILCGPGSTIRACEILGGIEILTGGAYGANDYYNLPVLVESSFAYWLVANDRLIGEKSTPVHIRDCQFKGLHATGYGQSAVVNFNNNAGCSVENSLVTWIASVTGVELAAANSMQPTRCRIVGCDFVHSSTGTFTSKHAIKAATCSMLTIEACNFDLVNALGGGVHLLDTNQAAIRDSFFHGNGVAGRTATDLAILFEATTLNEDTSILGCTFEGFNSGIANGRCIGYTGVAAIVELKIAECMFKGNGGYCLQLDSASTVTRVTLSNNIVRSTVALEYGFNIAYATNVTITGNILTFTAGSVTGIMADGVTGGVASGNRLDGCTISATAAVLWGYFGGTGPTNLNYIS